jgi:hypothetical protein
MSGELVGAIWVFVLSALMFFKVRLGTVIILTGFLGCILDAMV